MYKQNTVAVVITAYNEAEFVGDVIRSLPSFVDRAYAVDDRSTDGTWNEIQRAAALVNSRDDGPEVVSVRHEENRGVGATIKTGYRRAAEDGMDITAVLNGDGQMDPDILDRIVDPIAEGRADYAKGNRLLSREHVRGMSRWRRFGNGILTLLTKVASGYWKTMDPQNGYTAISLTALERLDLSALHDDYGFCNDVLIKLNARRMQVADVEMEAVYGDEESTISYTQFVPSVSLLLLTGFLWRLKVRYLVYDFHPLVGLYGLGAVGFASVAGALGVAALGAGAMPAPLTTVLVVLVSFLVLALGMSFDVANNEHLEHTELTGDSVAGQTPIGRSQEGLSRRSQPRPGTD